MKKTINLLLVFVLAFSLNSCGGSDDDSGGGNSSSDKIVGTWKYIGDTYLGDLEVYDGESCDDEFFKFSNNNSGQFIEKYCGEATETTSFVWAKTSDPVYNYTFEDENSGNFEVIVVFSTDFKRITIYETEDDFIEESYGEVYQKQ